MQSISFAVLHPTARNLAAAPFVWLRQFPTFIEYFAANSCPSGCPQERPLLGRKWFASLSHSSDAKVPDARSTSAQAASSGLSHWLSFCWSTPPVRLLPGVEPPTALSWLMRRGPDLNVGTLHRLFRERKVRVFDGEKVKHTSVGRVLQEGHLLLVPKSSVPGHEAEETPAHSPPHDGRRSGVMTPAHSPAHDGRRSAVRTAGREDGSPVREETAVEQNEFNDRLASLGLVYGSFTGGAVRRWVLAMHPEFLVLNKPAGVITQGGDLSLDQVMRSALVYDTEKDQPKLVHRLDRDVSGALLIARNADAAAWLGAAFRDKSVQVQDSSNGRRGKGGRKKNDTEGSTMYIKRTYLALVARGMEPKQSGRVNGSILVDGMHQPAVTHFRVLQSNNGLSLLQLVPETGRKHQLRIHCGRFLHAPIVGDTRYGYKGDPALQFAGIDLRRLKPRFGSRHEEAASSVSGTMNTHRPVHIAPIMLHSHSLVVSLPRKKPLLYVAPLPRYMIGAMQSLGWKPPKS